MAISFIKWVDYSKCKAFSPVQYFYKCIINRTRDGSHTRGMIKSINKKYRYTVIPNNFYRYIFLTEMIKYVISVIFMGICTRVCEYVFRWYTAYYTFP